MEKYVKLCGYAGVGTCPEPATHTWTHYTNDRFGRSCHEFIGLCAAHSAVAVAKGYDLDPITDQ